MDRRAIWSDGHAKIRALLGKALDDLSVDPNRAGVRSRPELGRDVCIYHLRHSRRGAGQVKSPRHLLLFRYDGGTLLIVGRILHDAMDLERHLPDEYGDEA